MYEYCYSNLGAIYAKGLFDTVGSPTMDGLKSHPGRSNLLQRPVEINAKCMMD